METAGASSQRYLHQNGSTMARDPNKRYSDTRRQFEELDLEQQASFLVEATASTLARGVTQVGEVLADGLEDILRRSRKGSRRAGREGPGPAEPETAQRQAPRNGGRRSEAGS